MTKVKNLLLSAALVVAAGLGTASPASAVDEACFDTPSDAVKSLPAPVRKWAQIGCTEFGQTLASREGWVWASLKDAAQVMLVARTVRNSDHFPYPSYFTEIRVDELNPEDLALALATFDRGLSFKEEGSKAYRVDVTMATGDVARIVFFDFGSFAGGMFCPDDNCLSESRFLIMKEESKDQLTASLDVAQQKPHRML